MSYCFSFGLSHLILLLIWVCFWRKNFDDWIEAKLRWLGFWKWYLKIIIVWDFFQIPVWVFITMCEHYWEKIEGICVSFRRLDFGWRFTLPVWEVIKFPVINYCFTTCSRDNVIGFNVCWRLLKTRRSLSKFKKFFCNLYGKGVLVGAFYFIIGYGKCQVVASAWVWYPVHPTFCQYQQNCLRKLYEPQQKFLVGNFVVYFKLLIFLEILYSFCIYSYIIVLTNKLWLNLFTIF